MSRALAGLGAGLGVVGGAVAGSYVGRAYPGRMTRDDSEMAWISIGAILGGFVGAVAGSGCPEQPAQQLPPPRFP